MARSRKATPATTAPAQTWKVPRPHLTPVQEGWQTRYRPAPCDRHGSWATWRLDPDLCSDTVVAFYCDFCGRYLTVAREEAADER